LNAHLNITIFVWHADHLNTLLESECSSLKSNSYDIAKDEHFAQQK